MSIKSNKRFEVYQNRIIMKKFTFNLLALCIAFTFGAKAQHTAHETENLKGTSVPPRLFFTHDLNLESTKDQELRMVLVTFGPGEKSAAHRHPIPTFGYVLEGELESTFEGKVYHYKKGDAFYEEPNGLHNGTRNPSKTKTAKLLAVFAGEKGKPFLVHEK